MGRRAGQAHGVACLGQTLNVAVPGQIAGVRQALGLPGGGPRSRGVRAP